MSDAVDILEQPDGVDNAVSMLDMINEVLGSFGSGDAPMQDDSSLEFPLEAAIRLLPRRYIKEFDESIVKGETLLIRIDDLFEQLKTGKVAVPIATLAFHIPANLVYSATFQDHTVMGLPVQLVVHSVGVRALAERMPKELRSYDIEGLDDPFPESLSSRSVAAAGDAPAVLLEGDDDDMAEDLPGEAQPLDMAEDLPAEPQPLDRAAPTFLAETEPEPEPTPAERPIQEQAPSADAVPETTFEYPASDAVRKLTNGVMHLPREMDPDATVRIDLPDVFEQLKRGKVTIPTHDFVKVLPSTVRISKHVLNAGETTPLALGTVVEALGIESLASRLSAPLRDFDIDRMVDPFPEPAERPPPLAEDRRVSSRLVADGQQSDVRHVPGGVAASDTSTPYHAAKAPAEQGYRELPGNININTATAEELMLLEGIDSTVAAKIIKYRSKNGLFATVFDLLKVPGIEAPTVEQMSGMRVGAGIFNRRRRLAALLHIPAGQVADLQLVAQAVTRKPDFSGCVVSDGNGLVLAQAGMDESADQIAAVVPRLLRRIHADMSLIGAGSPRTASITTSEMCFTVASHRAIAVSTIHRNGQINETDLAFVRKLVLELAWLISLHAYAGPAD